MSPVILHAGVFAFMVLPTKLVSQEEAGPARDSVERMPPPSEANRQQEALRRAAGMTSLPDSTRQQMVDGCQQRTRERLRAPSQARFYQAPSLSESEDAIEVFGRVEAMNGFGGYSELTYSCKILKNGTGYLAGPITIEQAR